MGLARGASVRGEDSPGASRDSAADSVEDELAAEIDEIIARPLFRASSFGVLFCHVRSGRILYEHDARKLFAPASTTKLLSCAGALDALGADFRFETRVVATGPLKEGTLAGDLVLLASGDPNLSQRLRARDRLAFENTDHSYAGLSRAKVVNGDPLAILRELARDVRRAGVTRVTGDIVVDDGLFAETFDPFVGKFSAACVNDNLVDVTVRPGRAVGEPVDFEVRPASEHIRVRSTAETAKSGSPSSLRLRLAAGGEDDSYELTGSIPLDASPSLRVAPFREPAMTCARLFAETLRAEGVRADGRTKNARFGPTIYSDYDVVARHVSAPLSQTIRVVLKVSQNVHATMLPPLVGARLGSRGSTREGYGIIRDRFAKSGLDMDSIVVTSGSGGGRADRISPQWLVHFLRYWATRPDFGVFLDALPISGVDGTLANEMRGSELSGKVRAKTGTLVYRNALNGRWIYLTKSLAGYLDLRTRSEKDSLWAFAIVISDTVTTNRRAGVVELFRAQADILRAARRAIAAGGGRPPRAESSD